MTVELFACRDEVADSFSAPIVVTSRECFLRDFKTTINSGNFPYPDDNSLFCLGEYDTVSGKITAKEFPEFVMRCSELVDKEVMPNGTSEEGTD